MLKVKLEAVIHGAPVSDHHCEKVSIVKRMSCVFLGGERI
jgi:hypothetical protein